MYKTIPAEQIAQRLQSGEDLVLIDIREPVEWTIAAIEGAEQRAMSQVNEWWQELPSDREVVIFCHHGSRSAHLCHALATQAGLSNLTNMSGGIDRWSLQVDPAVPRY
ncbi:MAG: rhodanese [Herpetosiphonaceae bacterium]|nr:rhodanese [Herpetosiphonaceae bacterium]